MGIKVLSLFDGVSCGQVALKELGIEVDTYKNLSLIKIVK